MRLVLLGLASFLLLPVAGASPQLAVEPASIELAPGEGAEVVVTSSGSDPDGGVYDLFVDASELLVAFEGGPPQGIAFLPGRDASSSWTARVRAPDDATPGERTLVFRLVERPPPQGRPLQADATLAARVIAPDAPIPAPSASEHAADAAAARSLRPTALPGGWVVGGAIGLGALAVGVPAVFRRVGGVWTFLYWRVRSDRLLDHPVRAQIMEAVGVSPGVTPAGLQRQLGLSDGQLDHHLRRLVHARFIVKVAQDGARHLYPAGFQVEEGPGVAARVRSSLSAGGPAAAASIAALADASPQQTRYYLEKMVRQGEAIAEWRAGRRVYRMR